MGVSVTVRASAVAVIAACALGVPATAAASCTNFSKMQKVKSYGGTASTSYVSGALTGPPPPSTGAGTATIDINRNASDLQIADLRQGAEGADFESLGQPTGGSVTVNDTYTDSTGSVHMTGSGPTKPGGDGNGVQILTNQGSCTYQVLVSFQIKTTSVITGFEETDTGIADNATSPATPIPSNLVLKGKANIVGTGGGASPGTKGLFDMSGDPVWGEDLEYVTGGHPQGTATIGWDLNPASAGCVVPKVAGLSERSAAKAIKTADCKLAKVSKSHSHKVAKGKTISSRPKAGTRKPAGAKVELVVSSGR